jgi:predicted  nucleic acid-binding Zn ribbon protein
MVFTPKTLINGEEIAELFWDYLSCLSNNGQIISDYLLTKDDSMFMTFVTIPEDNALDEKNNNIYLSKYLDKIISFFEISIEPIGTNLNTCSSCMCKEKPKWYLLYTNRGGPVVCGECGHSVPLYRLPHILGEDEYYKVLSWQKSYRAVYKLFMQCLADRFTYRQMNKLDSQLSKDGIEICQAFEDATGIPFYYYLFYYQKKQPTTCPSCSKDLKTIVKTKNIDYLDYKCHKCRLAIGYIHNS